MAQAARHVTRARSRRNPRPYDRAQAMRFLAERCPGEGFPDLTDTTVIGRAKVIECLHGFCTAMRAWGLRGAWHYSLPLHTELVRILAAEEAEIAALRQPTRMAA